MKLPASDASKQRRADQFVRFAEAFHGRLGHDRGHPVGAEHLPVLLGGKKARHEDVHAHALRCPFARQIFGNIMNRRLRR